MFNIIVNSPNRISRSKRWISIPREKIGKDFHVQWWNSSEFSPVLRPTAALMLCPSFSCEIREAAQISKQWMHNRDCCQGDFKVRLIRVNRASASKAKSDQWGRIHVSKTVCLQGGDAEAQISWGLLEDCHAKILRLRMPATELQGTVLHTEGRTPKKG